jgi:hypothetical protein
MSIPKAPESRATPMALESANQKPRTWRWLHWLLLAALITGGIASCFFMAAIHPHWNVLRFEPNYPTRNPNPSRVVSIAGSIPSNLQIKFLAYYAASRIQGYESCYRSMPLGPTFPLHVVEPLDAVRTTSTYEISVTVDKYQPGECGWTLDFVGYQLLDVDRDVVEEGFEKGGDVIVYFSRSSNVPSAGNSTNSWRGRVDLWCYKGPMGHGTQAPEFCSTLGGFPPEFQAITPDDKKGPDASTWILSEARSAEVNFHDLNALVAQNAEGK